MKILKWIVFVILGIIALALITGLFVKKDYAVEREITINKPKAEVFDYAKHIKNQDSYSVWNMKDLQSKREYTGTDGTVGFISSWDSENNEVGKGSQEIKKITEGERIDMELRFVKPFEATDNAYMITESIDSIQTKVKWGFNGTMKYPMNLMLLMMDFDKMLGDDLHKGLENMKANLEK